MKTSSPKENGQSGQTISFKVGDLEAALFNIEDIFDRALLDQKFIPLMDTAKAIYDGVPLYGNKIDVGVEKRYLIKEAISTLKSLPTYGSMYPELEITDKGFSYEYKGVPVNVRFINRNYKFFKRPDFKYYLSQPYNMPNPFETYWKSRWLIQ